MILAGDTAANAWAFGIAVITGVASIAVMVLQTRAAQKQREIVEHVAHINRAVNGAEEGEPTLRETVVEMVGQIAEISERTSAIDRRTAVLESQSIIHSEQLAEVRIQFRNHLKDHRTEALLNEVAQRGPVERRSTE